MPRRADSSASTALIESFRQAIVDLQAQINSMAIKAGVKGDKGDRGEQGLTGSSGSQGDPGQVGPAGATGAAGTTGAQGPKGDRGDVGPAGPQGPAGVTNVTISSGTYASTLSLLTGGSPTVMVPLNTPMPDTNYQATACIVGSSQLLGAVAVKGVSAKAVGSVSVQLAITGLSSLIGTNYTVEVIAIKVS